MTTRTWESILTCWGPTNAAVCVTFGFLHTYETLTFSESPGPGGITVSPPCLPGLHLVWRCFHLLSRNPFTSSVRCFMERGMALDHIPASNVQRPIRNLLLFRGRRVGVILHPESEKALPATKSHADFYTSCPRTYFCCFRHLLLFCFSSHSWTQNGLPEIQPACGWV